MLTKNSRPFSEVRTQSKRGRKLKFADSSFNNFSTFLKKSKSKQRHYLSNTKQIKLQKLIFNDSSATSFLPPKGAGSIRQRLNNRTYSDRYQRSSIKSNVESTKQKIKIMRGGDCVDFSSTVPEYIKRVSGQRAAMYEQFREQTSDRKDHLKSKIESNAMKRFKQLFSRESQNRNRQIEDEQSKRLLNLLEQGCSQRKRNRPGTSIRKYSNAAINERKNSKMRKQANSNENNLAKSVTQAFAKIKTNNVDMVEQRGRAVGIQSQPYRKKVSMNEGYNRYGYANERSQHSQQCQPQYYNNDHDQDADKQRINKDSNIIGNSDVEKVNCVLQRLRFTNDNSDHNNSKKQNSNNMNSGLDSVKNNNHNQSNQIQTSQLIKPSQKKDIVQQIKQKNQIKQKQEQRLLSLLQQKQQLILQQQKSKLKSQQKGSNTQTQQKQQQSHSKRNSIYQDAKGFEHTVQEFLNIDDSEKKIGFNGFKGENYSGMDTTGTRKVNSFSPGWKGIVDDELDFLDNVPKIETVLKVKDTEPTKQPQLMQKQKFKQKHKQKIQDIPKPSISSNPHAHKAKAVEPHPTSARISYQHAAESGKGDSFDDDELQEVITFTNAKKNQPQTQVQAQKQKQKQANVSTTVAANSHSKGNNGISTKVIDTTVQVGEATNSFNNKRVSNTSISQNMGMNKQQNLQQQQKSMLSTPSFSQSQLQRQPPLQSQSQLAMNQVNTQINPLPQAQASPLKQNYQQQSSYQELSSVLGELNYMVDLLENLGVYYKESKSFYANIDSSMIELSMNFKLAAYFVAQQFYFYERHFIQFMEGKVKGPFYSLEQSELIQAMKSQDSIDILKDLKEKFRTTDILIKQTYEKCKAFLSKQDKKMNIDPTVSYHQKSLKYLKEEFKLLYQLLEKNQSNLTLAQRCCFVIETFLILKALKGNEIKEFEEVDQIGNENLLKHIQKYKKHLS